MHRDHQQQAGFKAKRKEWGHTGNEPHQGDAREHARMPSRTHRTHDVLAAEAERQIRELRRRY